MSFRCNRVALHNNNSNDNNNNDIGNDNNDDDDNNNNNNACQQCKVTCDAELERRSRVGAMSDNQNGV